MRSPGHRGQARGKVILDQKLHSGRGNFRGSIGVRKNPPKWKQKNGSFVGYYYLSIIFDLGFSVVHLLDTSIFSGAYWPLDTTIQQPDKEQAQFTGISSEFLTPLDTKILNTHVHLSSTHYMVNTFI